MAEPRTHFHLFAYGTMRRGGSAASLLDGAQLVGEAQVNGVLYDIDGQYHALMLYGPSPVAGEVYRCPNELLATLDAFQSVDDGLFRRIGVEARLSDETTVPCWVYVAGAALSRKLVPAARV